MPDVSTSLASSLSAFPRLAGEELLASYLRMCENWGLDPKTIRAYASDFNAFLEWRERCAPWLALTEMDEEDLATFVADTANGGGRRGTREGATVRHIANGAVLSNATINRRLSALRGFFSYLHRKGLIELHPIPAGARHMRTQMGGGAHNRRSRAARRVAPPWIPSDAQWSDFLAAVRYASLRDRMIVAATYDLALRRETVAGLELSDFDFSSRDVQIRAEIVKNGSTPGTLRLTPQTGLVLQAYLPTLKDLERRSRKKCNRLFRSESDRNLGGPLHESSINRVFNGIRAQARLPQFHPHTLRHLRLTHMARAGMDVAEIQAFAGHRSIETTMLYLHLTGREISDKVAKNMKLLNDKLAQLVEAVT
jgi:integrase/recombinase XerD